ncbi:MAG: hypothetical protein ABRQ26_08640 [Syntrophomonadaceae bacterium]
MNRESQPEIYTAQLEELLDRLHKDISSNFDALTDVKDVRQLDDYILQLNSFYYGSFHEKIFPLYRQLIQEDMQAQLNLALQEDTLRQGILGNIKRYAQLYNQVKRLTATLNQGKEITYRLILTNDRREDHNSIDLYAALRHWREHVQASAGQVGKLEEIIEDRDFCQALGKSLGNWPVVHFLEQVDLSQPEQGSCYTDLLSYLNYCRALLRQMQKEDKPYVKSSGIFKELDEQTTRLLRRSMPVSFANYRQYWSDLIGGILPTLPLYVKLGESELYKNSLRRLLQQCDDHILLLERAQHLLIGGYREVLLLASRGPLERSFDIKQLQANLNRILDSLNALEKEFSLPGESDFQNFSQQAGDRLEEAGELLYKPGPYESATPALMLFTGLYRLDLERQYLLRTIEMMREDFRRRHELQEVLLHVVNSLDSFTNLLGNIRADLERLLAPRNLSRLWKDLDVRVERIPLENGKPFPSRFLHLLDKNKLDQLPAGSEDILVLYEEGDLFIIRVGSEQDEEIPYVNIARKEQPHEAGN